MTVTVTAIGARCAGRLVVQYRNNAAEHIFRTELQDTRVGGTCPGLYDTHSGKVYDYISSNGHRYDLYSKFFPVPYGCVGWESGRDSRLIVVLADFGVGVYFHQHEYVLVTMEVTFNSISQAAWAPETRPLDRMDNTKSFEFSQWAPGALGRPE